MVLIHFVSNKNEHMAICLATSLLPSCNTIFLGKLSVNNPAEGGQGIHVGCNNLMSSKKYKISTVFHTSSQGM